MREFDLTAPLTSLRMRQMRRASSLCTATSHEKQLALIRSRQVPKISCIGRIGRHFAAGRVVSYLVLIAPDTPSFRTGDSWRLWCSSPN